ncbi:MAG TPA: hypothetical protein RMH99_32270 [Sandaracinaceae bacterium LLY-WYZ-13_1]|nr:hypothetical protein [Sandaracinaceae bacterium LLY-WYZ-13_1]
MRRAPWIGGLLLLAACGEPAPERDAGLDEGSPTDAAGLDAAGGPDASLDAAVMDAAGPDAGVDAGAPPCAWDDPRPPPPSVLWPDVLNGTGAETLGGHGHDDGRGPVGFCAGTPAPGEPFYRLVAVGFETDEDVNGDGDQADALPVGFWRDPASFDGVGESAGRINVYLEVVDESGAVLDRRTDPALRFVREIRDGPTDPIPIDDKPDAEFQTNFPMTGGAVYAVEVEGASDRVHNLRLPVNHHVTFALVFRRERP